MRKQRSLLLKEKATLNFCFNAEWESLTTSCFGKTFLLNLLKMYFLWCEKGIPEISGRKYKRQIKERKKKFFLSCFWYVEQGHYTLLMYKGNYCFPLLLLKDGCFVPSFRIKVKLWAYQITRETLGDIYFISFQANCFVQTYSV